MPGNRIKKAANITGSLVAIASIAFVLYKLTGSWETLSEHTNPSKLILPLFYLSAIYGISQILISRGWHILLVLYQREKVTFRLAHKINARTQIAKYLPSNILHHAGRLTLGKLYGIEAGALMKASMDEILLMVFSASLLSGLLFSISGAPWHSIIGQYIDAVMMVIFFLVIIRLAFHIAGFRKNGAVPTSKTVTSIAFSGLHYFAFVLVTATINTALANEVLVFSEAGQVLAFMAIFILAWLIGLLTPGAPGGIGIREAILLMTLSGTYNEASILLIAISSRIISIVGDMVFFCLSLPGSYTSGQETQ